MPCACCAALIVVTLVASGGTAFAVVQSDSLEMVVDKLPELPGAADAAPGYVDMDGDSAGFGYASRSEKWSARLDRRFDTGANLEVDYGMLLTNRLSAGGRITHADDFSEVVVNGVFAPQKNVRLRFTGAQLRNAYRLSPFDGAYNDAFVQNSYLFTARKHWHKYELLSDLGLSAYSTQANTASSLAEDPMDMFAEPSAFGRKEGYMFNLGLHPTSRSRIELRREFSHLSYYLGEDARSAAQHNTSRVKYSHFLDNCVRVQGGVSTGPDEGRVDVNIARNNWSLNLSREQYGDADNTAIRIGYSLPLGTKPSRSSTCGGTIESVPALEPIVDTSSSRPAQLPDEPLLMQMP